MSKTAFQIAAEKRKQQQEEKDSKKGFGGGFEETKYAGIPKTGEAVGRFIGVPLEVRELPWHAKQVYLSTIINDTNKYSRFVWPQEFAMVNGFALETGNLDESFIMTQIIRKVFESKWTEWDQSKLNEKGFKFDTTKQKIVNEKGHTGYYQDIHIDAPSYKWLKDNSFAGNTRKFIPNAKPGPRVLLPYLDRTDDWCKLNAHSKLFSTKYDVAEKDGKTVVYTDTGVTISWYKFFFDTIEKGTGDMEAMDFVMWKTRKPNLNTFDYTIKGITEMVPDSAKKIGNSNPITDEERAYKHYDLDKIFQYTKYGKILKNFEKRIRQVDIDFNSHFHQMLVELAKVEAEKAAADKAASATTTSAPSSYDDGDDSDEGEAAQPAAASSMDQAVQSRAGRPARVSETLNATESKCESYFTNWDKLSTDDKAEILKHLSRFENNLPVWSTDDNMLDCDNPECKYPGSAVRTRLPNTTYACPCCGTKFV